MVKRLLLFVMLMSGCWSFANAQSSDKDFINETGNDLLNQWDAEAYRNVAALLNLALSYDSHEITQWGVNCLKAMKHAITEPYHGISDGYMMYLRTSSFTGHFKVVNNRWVKEGDADDVQFAFTDESGNPCVFKFVTKGNTKSISVEVDDDDDYSFDDDDDSPYDSDVIDDVTKGVKFVTIDVPERIEISMTQGSKQLMLTTIEFDLSLIVNDWNLIDNGFIMSINSSYAKSTGSGTFEMGLNQVGYKPGTGISFSFMAKNEGKTLVSLSLNAPGTINPYYDDDFDFARVKRASSDYGLQSMNFDVDVMGRIQVQGNIPDLGTFSELMDEVEYSESEAEAKSIIASLSNQMTCNMYYNNGSQSKGTFSFEAYYDEEFEEWTSRPIITFASDNSTYALKEYFSEENFPFISDMQNIVTDLQELIGSLGESINKMNEDAEGINEPAIANNKMSFDGHQLLLSGLQAGAKVEVFTVGGRLCCCSTAGANGQAIVPFSSQPSGIYLIKTPSGNRKFIKR